MRARSGVWAAWLGRRPPREAERGGTTSGLEWGGQSPSFGGAQREWTPLGAVGGRGEQRGPTLDQSPVGVGPTLWELKKTYCKDRIVPDPSGWEGRGLEPVWAQDGITSQYSFEGRGCIKETA